VSFGVFLKKISCVDGEGFAWWGRVWAGIRLELVPRRRKQFSRFACGFTPACGSEVRADGPVVYGTAEAVPLRGGDFDGAGEVGLTSCAGGLQHQRERLQAYRCHRLSLQDFAYQMARRTQGIRQDRRVEGGL
jgi:hypothetical protein